MGLRPAGSIALPPHPPSGGFDHGDVDPDTGRVFLAHTAAGSVEMIDAAGSAYAGTIPGCAEASGVLCAPRDRLVFAAATGAGKVLVIDAGSGRATGAIPVGPKPNGLAWDGRRRRLLVADVDDFKGRLADPSTAAVIAAVDLPGRPRWCIYEAGRDRFLINIRQPACVAVLDAESTGLTVCWPVSSAGPHGLDLDQERGRAYVACDGGRVIALDLETGREVADAAIAGEPDAIWYNPDRSHLYVAIGQPGLIAVVDTSEMTVVQQIVTEPGAHTTAFDRARQRLYVFLPATCRAAVYTEA